MLPVSASAEARAPPVMREPAAVASAEGSAARPQASAARIARAVAGLLLCSSVTYLGDTFISSASGMLSTCA